MAKKTKQLMSLKDLAKEMNDVMGLKPAIKTVAIKEDALLDLIKKAAINIEPETDIDEFSEEAVETLKEMALWPDEDPEPEEDPDKEPEEDPEEDENAAMIETIKACNDIKDLKIMVKSHDAFSRMRKRATTMFDRNELKTQMLLALGCEDFSADSEEEKEEKKPVSKKDKAPALVAKAEKKTEKKEEKSAGKKPSLTPVAIEFLTPLIAKGKFTQKELIEKVSEKIGMKETSTQTLLTDARNPKYNKFEKLVVKNDSGILSFKK